MTATIEMVVARVPATRRITMRNMRQHELWKDFLADVRCGWCDTESEHWDEESWLTRFLEWLDL